MPCNTNPEWVAAIWRVTSPSGEGVAVASALNDTLKSQQFRRDPIGTAELRQILQQLAQAIREARPG
jgi:hypothetical protein